MAFYSNNAALVDFIAESFGFPPEMLDHLKATVPDEEERAERIVQLCMTKYVVGNGLVVPESADSVIKMESAKSPAFVNAFLAYAVLRRFGAAEGANYTIQ